MSKAKLGTCGSSDPPVEAPASVSSHPFIVIVVLLICHIRKTRHSGGLGYGLIRLPMYDVMTTVKTKVEIPRRGRGKGVYLSACVGVTPLKPRVESRVCAKEPQPGTTADHNPHVPVWLGRADARSTRHRSTTHRIHNAQSTNVGQTQNVTHSVTHFF